LYSNPEVPLRELLQNSIDACLLRDALEKSWGNSYHPEIQVSYYNDNGEDILEIIDNGTGMDQHIIDSYYSRIGSSFYKSSEFFDLKSKSNANFIPASRFGIGILSCFMVADTLIVETRKVYGPHDSSEPINLTVEGQESIFWIKPGERKIPGTSTKLILRKRGIHLTQVTTTYSMLVHGKQTMAYSWDRLSSYFQRV
jgi:HSP90 family molecular chaperone